jgi:hypothetical protein
MGTRTRDYVDHSQSRAVDLARSLTPPSPLKWSSSGDIAGARRYLAQMRGSVPLRQRETTSTQPLAPEQTRHDKFRAASCLLAGQTVVLAHRG